jgi:thymidylate synthase (FAD)
MLISRDHEAMLEHVSASFRIITDRGISHELVRHRIASFAQESTRFCSYAKDKFNSEITVIEPDFSGAKNDYEQPEEVTRTIWREAVSEAESAYLKLIRNNISPQFARSVLPNCLKTEINMTANAREWRHFLKLRLAPAAHPQIREISAMIKEKLTYWADVLFDDIK